MPPRANLWSSPAFRRLATTEQLLAAFAYHGPHCNRAGFVRLTEAHIAHALGRVDDLPAVRRDWLHVANILGWHVDGAASVVWFPGWRLAHPARSTHDLRAALADACEVEAAGPSPLFDRFLDDLTGLAGARRAWWIAQTDRVRRPLPPTSSGSGVEMEPHKIVVSASSEKTAALSRFPPSPPYPPFPLSPSPDLARSVERPSAARENAVREEAPATGDLFEREEIRATMVDSKIAPARLGPGEVVRRYAALWRSRYGRAPIIASPDLGVARRIADAAPFDALTVVEKFMRSDEPYLVERRHPLNLLTAARINAILAAPVAPRVSHAAATSGDWRTRSPRT